MRARPPMFDPLAEAFFQRGEEIEVELLREAEHPDDLADLDDPPAHTPLPLSETKQLRGRRRRRLAEGTPPIQRVVPPAVPRRETVTRKRFAIAAAVAIALAAVGIAIPADRPAPPIPQLAAAERAAPAPRRTAIAQIPREPGALAPPAAVAAQRPPVAKRHRANAPRRDPARARARYRRGVAAFKRGNTAAAVRSFRAALRADPRYAPAYRGLGLGYRRQHRDARAVRALKKYLRVSPRAKDRAQVERLIRQLSQ